MSSPLSPVTLNASRFRTPIPSRLLVLAAFAFVAIATSGLASAQGRPYLQGIEYDASGSDEVTVLAVIDGGVPAATQVRFADEGRAMVLEMAGVDLRMNSDTIRVGDPRLDRIVIQELPGGVQIRMIAGDTQEPFAGRLVEPVIIPTGLKLTLWRSGMTTLPDLPPAGLPLAIDAFELGYAKEHPDNPDLAQILAETSVSLTLANDGFRPPRSGLELATFTLDSVPDPRTFVPTSIRYVNQAIVESFNARGIAGVYVEPHPDDIDPDSLRDMRRGRKTLRLQIWTGRLLEARTFASGSRVPEAESIDHPVHARIKDASPVQAGDLLLKDEIDDYIYRMNRHPGRVIDTAPQNAGEPGGVYLDYLVNDDRPWSAYAQVANIGAEGTGTLRERFGFSHNQLTNRDDILQLDYITGDFDEVHAAFGSYDLPLFWDNRVRARVGGSYVEYDSEQFGVSTIAFSGDLWSVDAEIRATVFQRDNFFIDLIGGIEWREVTVENTFGTSSTVGASENFFLPEIGVQISRRERESSFSVSVSNRWNADSAAGTSDLFAFELGSPLPSDNADSAFEILDWNATASIYLDALLAADDSAVNKPLVHEFYLMTRGQYAWGNALAPQFQDVLTGYFAVRGYPQSIVAGDDLVIGRAEYRFHLPRALPLGSAPFDLPLFGEFKAQPMQENGIPDWDLILRVFSDAGYSRFEDRLNRSNETLVSAGVGLEFRFMRHLILTADYGIALRDIRSAAASQKVDVGDGEFHLLGTVVY